MIYIFTGGGQGKTTAAIGLGIRSLGQDKKVLMIQFIKSEEFLGGEEKVIKGLGDNFRLMKGGKGFVGILGDKLSFSEHQKTAQETFKEVKEAVFSEKYDLVILDEINVALKLKLISLEGVLNLVKKTPQDLDLVLTGRDAPAELIGIADLVTECKEVKHYFGKEVEL